MLNQEGRKLIQTDNQNKKKNVLKMEDPKKEKFYLTKYYWILFQIPGSKNLTFTSGKIFNTGKVVLLHLLSVKLSF